MSFMLLSDCHYPEWILKWIDLCQYSIPQVILSGLGEILWTAAYIWIIVDAIKHKYVQMPGIVATANLSWELLASFVFPSPGGKLLGLGFLAWFILDLAIFILILKYGHKQLPPDQRVKYYKPIIIASFCITLLLQYLYFVDGPMLEHYTLASFLLNLVISAQFLLNLNIFKVYEFMSLKVGWAKMLGTACITISVMLEKDPQPVVIAMGLIIFAMDILYILVLKKEKKEQKQLSIEQVLNL